MVNERVLGMAKEVAGLVVEAKALGEWVNADLLQYASDGLLASYELQRREEIEAAAEPQEELGFT